MNSRDAAKIKMRCLELAAKYSDNTHENARIAEKFFRTVMWGKPYGSEDDKQLKRHADLQAKEEANDPVVAPTVWPTWSNLDEPGKKKNNIDS